MKGRERTLMRAAGIGLVLLFLVAVSWLLRACTLGAGQWYPLLAVCACPILLAGVWVWYGRRQTYQFAEEVCLALDALIAGQRPENYIPCEDTLAAKVQERLLRYYDIVEEGRLQSQQDKQTLQELVSDISHQVKAPVANLRMFSGILLQHELPCEKRAEFLRILADQVDKLDFLMQSLIKMSRLETGILALHMEDSRLGDTIAQAINTVWAKAEAKEIQLSVAGSTDATVRHDPKWTAEALGNILDNAVKYTPPGGSVAIHVRPWELYTRIDISDTGMGIAEEHYHEIFRRFYRAREALCEEGVGLGLYLANSIITRQEGYISVKSSMGEGTTFSVYLLG